jgi:hypothetical protein
MRAAINLVVAGLFLSAGFTHVASVVLVLSVIQIVGAMELQIARVFLETWQSGWSHLKGTNSGPKSPIKQRGPR